jgi:hypothetical protein
MIAWPQLCKPITFGAAQPSMTHVLLGSLQPPSPPLRASTDRNLMPQPDQPLQNLNFLAHHQRQLDPLRMISSLFSLVIPDLYRLKRFVYLASMSSLFLKARIFFLTRCYMVRKHSLSDPSNQGNLQLLVTDLYTDFLCASENLCSVRIFPLRSLNHEHKDEHLGERLENPTSKCEGRG